MDLESIIHTSCLETIRIKQGRKRPLNTPKRMIDKREREGERKKGDIGKCAPTLNRV